MWLEFPGSIIKLLQPQDGPKLAGHLC